MKNLNKLEKSKGVVVFAFNTDDIDYVTLADTTSKLTSQNLNLPITLITDHSADPKFEYDNIIRISNDECNLRLQEGQYKSWKNFGRYLAYELSPYDTTILLDGDYLVLDDSLLKLTELNYDYLLMRNSHSLNGPLYQLMGFMSLPFIWATVVIFNKSKRTENFFSLIGRIQRNYAYYQSLFYGEGTYRNDYSFAMADIILNGYTIESYKSIPWSMLTIEDNIKHIEKNSNKLVVRFDQKTTVIAKQNIHVMDKQFLLSKNFKDFVKNETN